MSTETIDTSRIRPYCSTPTDIIQNIRDPYALSVYVYLRSLPRDWEVHPHHVMKHFGVGVRIWRKAASVLRDAGLFVYVQTKNGKKIVLTEKERTESHGYKNAPWQNESHGDKTASCTNVTPYKENKEQQIIHKGETRVSRVCEDCNPELYDKNGNYIRKKHRATASAPAPDPVPEAHTLDDRQDTPRHNVEKQDLTERRRRPRGRRIPRDPIGVEDIFYKALSLGFQRNVWEHEAQEFHDYYKSVGFKRGNAKVKVWEPVLKAWENRRVEAVKRMRTEYSKDDYGETIRVDRTNWSDGYV